MTKGIPVFDLHCDLLAYLVKTPGASIHDAEAIGAALPHLQAGGVSKQVLAIYAPTGAGSSQLAAQQVARFAELAQLPQFHPICSKADLANRNSIGIVPAIENASGFCEEWEQLEVGFRRLATWINELGTLAYISLTHHDENRFGGGNYAPGVGLKPDGEALLDFLHAKNIPVDLSHASDALAEGIFTYLTRQRLDIPVIASHSSFRTVHAHARNLPDELALEIFHRGGIIGINFLRAYVHPSRPHRLLAQVAYGWHLPGGPDGLALGADFFATADFPDPSRHPLFFQQHANASQYQKLLASWEAQQPGLDVFRLGARNAERFYQRIWSL